MAFNLASLIIGMVLVSMVALSAAMFMDEQGTNYGTTLDTNFTGGLDVTENVSIETNTIRQKIQSSGILSITGVGAMLDGAFAVLKLMMSIVFLPITVMYYLLKTVFFLPDFVAAGITAIITLVVAFLIISALLGRNRT